jgi:hypothetical protein
MCRFLGYQQALNEWDIQPDPSLVCELDDWMRTLMLFISTSPILTGLLQL